MHAGEFFQFLASGLTVGSIYALVGLGFAIIYNASTVINFAQGEFVMIGGMATVWLLGQGLPMWIAIPIAIFGTALVGVLLEKFAVEPAKDASVVSLIIITIGASIFLRGLAQLLWGKGFHRLPSFSGDTPVHILGASIQPQSLWVMGLTVLIVLCLRWFFGSTLFGKAMLGTSYNPLAAQLVGIDTKLILVSSFALSAALGAVAGIMIAPITLTYYNAGVSLGLKGFAAAILGGLGSGMGAVVGGLLLGVIEAMSAGYLSSAYKEAVAFVVILGVLFFLPNGLFGKRSTERV